MRGLGRESLKQSSMGGCLDTQRFKKSNVVLRLRKVLLTFFTEGVDEDLHGAYGVNLETGLAPLRLVLLVEVPAILRLISSARITSGMWTFTLSL